MRLKAITINIVSVWFNKHKVKLILVVLILIGGLLRFYNLNWGNPFHFHPDERNIASAVTQLNFPHQMNPHFFAYGSLPIYAVYFTGVIQNFVTQASQPFQVLFSNAIIISRFYSATLSILLIPLLFLIGKKLKDNKAGILAAFFATTSVGFIQFAHFGTFEMWLTFFGALLLFLCLKVLDKKSDNIIFWMGIVTGILIAVKISSFALIPIPFAAIFFKNRRSIPKLIEEIIFFALIIVSLFVLSNSYAFLDFSSFLESIKYEAGVVSEAGKVFYTGGFYNSIPVIFQFTKIYPFLLNPLLAAILIPSLFYLIRMSIKTKDKSFLILNSFFLILFLSQAFLFAKWTRYMMPTLPFIYLIISIAISDVIARSPFDKLRTTKQSLRLPSSQFILSKVEGLAMTILVFICTLFALSYFITAFVRPDSRIQAGVFARKNIPQDAKILSEPYDLGLMPFESGLTNIKIFNFYDLDSASIDLLDELKSRLAGSDYIILPSPRLLRNRILNKDQFPLGNNFYQSLLDGELGYQKIYQTPCDIFCKITYLGDPIFSYEETASVFDRPTVMIFKKSTKK